MKQVVKWYKILCKQRAVIRRERESNIRNNLEAAQIALQTQQAHPALTGDPKLLPPARQVRQCHNQLQPEWR